MPSKLLLFAYVYAACGGFLFGYDIGCITGALPHVRSDVSLNITDTQAEIFVGQCKTGAALGAVAATWTLGRGYRVSFWCSAFAYVVGPLLIASSSDWVVLAIGRLIVGTGVGLSAVASPTYLAEIAPPASRGFIVGSFELMLTVGVLVAAAVNCLLQMPSVAAAVEATLPRVALWRLMLGLPAVPAVPFFIGSLFLPEAPTALAVAGRLDAALDVVRRLHGKWHPTSVASDTSVLGDDAGGAAASHGGSCVGVEALPTAPIAKAPLRHEASGRSSDGSNDRCSSSNTSSDHQRLMRFTTEASDHGSFADLPLSQSAERLQLLAQHGITTVPPVGSEERQMLDTLLHARAMGQRTTPTWVLLTGRERRAAVLMACLAIVNQANGSSTLLNYAAELLTSPQFGLSNSFASILSFVVCAMKLVCVLASITLVDSCGRRPLLVTGAALTAASLALAAYASRDRTAASAPLVITGLIAFVAFYALSLAPTFYTLLSELFSPAARPLAAGIGTALTFASGAAMDTAFLSMRHAVGYEGIFGIFAGVCVLGGLMVLLLLPETKGKTLYEIQHLLGTDRLCGRSGGADAALEHDDEAAGLSQPFSAQEEAGLPRRTSSAFVLAS